MKKRPANEFEAAKMAGAGQHRFGSHITGAGQSLKAVMPSTAAVEKGNSSGKPSPIKSKKGKKISVLMMSKARRGK